MDIQHIHSQKVAFTPAHIQLACDGVYMALPLSRTSVGVWSLQNIACLPLELIGHSKILTALALGHRADPKVLVSAGEDYVIVWDLLQARQQAEKGEITKGRVIGTSLGYIQYCAFSPNDALVAACVGAEVVILHAQRECQIATLEGHNGMVTGAEFCPHYTSTLVSVSEDRTFKVWNLSDMSLLYQSPILTASPFLSLAMSLSEPRVAIGATDGMVRVFDLGDGGDFRCLHQVDVGKFIINKKEQKQIEKTEKKKGPVTISSRPTWKRPDNVGSDECDPVDSLAETGTTVLGLYYTYLPQDHLAREASSISQGFTFSRKNHVVKELLDSAPMLVVGTTSGLIQINARTLDICSYVDLQDPVPSTTSDSGAEGKLLNAAGTVICGQGADHSKIYCIIGSPFQNVVHVLEWRHAGGEGSKTLGPAPVSTGSIVVPMRDYLEQHVASINLMATSHGTVDPGGELTVLSDVPMLEDSILRNEYTPKQKDQKDKKPKDFVTPPKKGKILDNQPLTFKSRVKSSGYTAAPRTTMFTPCTDFSNKNKKPPSRASTGGTMRPLTQCMKEYPLTGGAPQHLKQKITVAERPTAINSIRISDDGQGLACALANKSALVFSLPLTDKSDKGSTAFTGHNHIVRSVSWSRCGSRLLTSSDDKTAAVWLRGQSDPVMTFNNVNHNLASGDSTAKDKENKVFSREIHHGQFYYMDKFILMCSGNLLLMYKYHLDNSKDDIKRYLSQSRYRLVQQWSMESQHITSMSAINTFFSYIVLCGGSNKSVEVYDMNVGRRVRTMTEIHTRPVHNICQNEGSQFVSHPGNVYDLFVTAAAGDCIKLWDLRTNRCVRRYEGHQNRVHPCGVTFSPCGRFIASGSEDKAAYIFDLRSGTYLHKLIGQTDVVSDVTFHPLHPQLFTGSLDGRLQQYNSR